MDKTQDQIWDLYAGSLSAINQNAPVCHKTILFLPLKLFFLSAQYFDTSLQYSASTVK